MKDIQVWNVSEPGGAITASLCDAMDRTDTEKKLEDLLVEVPQILGDVVLVGRQTATDGGPLDLLGVDAEGRLVVFELKRGALTRDAVAQVVDYVSFLAEMDAQTLARHIEGRSGTGGIPKIEDFDAWHKEQFGSDAYTETPRAVLVGLGVDDTTRRMVDFLASAGMEVSLLTFHAFKAVDGFLLARHVEVHQAVKPKATGRKYTKSENQQFLTALADSLGVKTLLESMKSDARSALADAHVWPHSTCYSMSFIETSDSGNSTYRKYVGLHLDEREPGKVQVVLESRAVTTDTVDVITAAMASATGAKTATDPGDTVKVSFDVAGWEGSKDAWLEVFRRVRAAYETRKSADDNGDDAEDIEDAGEVVQQSEAHA